MVRCCHYTPLTAVSACGIHTCVKIDRRDHHVAEDNAAHRVHTVQGPSMVGLIPRHMVICSV
jgi:hypothetical protein